MAMERRKLRKMVLGLVLGGLAGFFGSLGLLQLIDSGALGVLDRSREIAALVGALYVICGLMVGLGLLSPKMGAQVLNVEDADELREQAAVLRYSVFGMVALGAVLLVLAFAAPAGPIPQTAALAIVVALIALSWFTSWRQMRLVDELVRSMSSEGTSLAFYLLFLIGGGWSIAAHLGYLTGPAPLDWITMFAGLLLLAVFWVAGRRGMLAPR